MYIKDTHTHSQVYQHKHYSYCVTPKNIIRLTSSSEKRIRTIRKCVSASNSAMISDVVWCGVPWLKNFPYKFLFQSWPFDYSMQQKITNLLSIRCFGYTRRLWWQHSIIPVNVYWEYSIIWQYNCKFNHQHHLKNLPPLLLAASKNTLNY